MGGGVAGQDAGVHADGAIKAAEPEHGRAHEMGAAGGGIDFKTDAGADDAVFAVAKCAVECRMMIRVFFEHGEFAGGGSVAGLAAGDGAVDADFFAAHEINALMGDGDDDVGIVLRHCREDARGGSGRVLSADEFFRRLHARAAEPEQLGVGAGLAKSAKAGDCQSDRKELKYAACFH